MKKELIKIENNNKNIVKISSLAKTYEGREVYAVKVSDNVNIDENEVAVLIMGAHHGNELISSEVPIFLLRYLIENYGNETIKSLIDRVELFFVPMVNPDGHEYKMSGNEWRKNRREIDLDGDGIIDGIGVDLNRNYPHLWKLEGTSELRNDTAGIYCGPYPLSENETFGIASLAIKERPTISLSYHSFGEFVLYPWGNSIDNQRYVSRRIHYIAENISKLMNYTPMRAADLYPATGDSDDWLWSELNTYPFTIELGRTPYPSDDDVREISNRSISAILYTLQIAIDVFESSLVIEKDKSIIIAPNEKIVVGLNLTNNFSNTNINFELSTEKLEWNVTLDKKEFFLKKFESAVINISIIAPANSTADEKTNITVFAFYSEDLVKSKISVVVMKVYNVVLNAIGGKNITINTNETKIPIRIGNFGNFNLSIALYAKAPTNCTAVLSKELIAIGIGEEKTLELNITIDEPEVPKFKIFEITAVVDDYKNTLNLTIHIPQIFNIILRAGNTKLKEGEKKKLLVELENLGNGDDDVTITALTKFSSLSVIQKVELKKSEKKYIEFELYALSKNGRYDLTIYATSKDNVSYSSISIFIDVEKAEEENFFLHIISIIPIVVLTLVLVFLFYTWYYRKS
ncbi:MAG: M14 family metallopeptidase [Candidatus Thermoplasmatota archaeon]